MEFRTKPQIALELIDRALGNGVRVAAWTFDELYGRDGKFLNGLQQRGQTFVAEVPVDFHGWVEKPRILRTGPKRSKKRGRRKKYPRLARRRPSSEVRNLVKYSPVFREKSWQQYHIKDTNKQSDRLSVEQVRSAMNTWLAAADLKPAQRKERYEKELKNQRYYQRRSQASRKCHTKTKVARLQALGIDANKIKSCVGWGRQQRPIVFAAPHLQQ